MPSISRFTLPIRNFGKGGAVTSNDAIVDRLIHHSHVHVLKGDSYRLKDKQQEVTAAAETT